MRRLASLALVLPVVSGCGGHAATRPSAPVNPVPRWIAVEHLPQNATRGAVLFYASGCTVCHMYAGAGTTNLHAPDLTSIGKRQLGIQFQVAHLKCPSCVVPGSPMPPFASLGARRLRQVAVFMEASKGTH